MRPFKIIALALVLCCSLFLVAAVALAAPEPAPKQAPKQADQTTPPGTGLKLEAKGAILLDAQSGRVLWEQNAHVRSFPASMTKLMTLILAWEAIESGKASLDEPVTASKRASDMEGSRVFLDVGETFSMEKMLLAVAVASANDASVAVAEHLAGTEDNFVSMMNAKAKEIGCKDTNFVNSHGPPRQEPTTARPTTWPSWPAMPCVSQGSWSRPPSNGPPSAKAPSLSWIPPTRCFTGIPARTV